ncbi:MAG: sensor histidine kinase [Daejeonella sp.]
MRDIISKKYPKEIPRLHYHIIAWSLFITYEVSLSAAIRGSYNHFSDYLLHYLLYILLFYVHCYLVLGTVTLSNIFDYVKLLVYLSLELTVYYCCNVIINEYLVSSGLPVNVIDTSSELFHLATFYRFIYIAALSTAFRIAVNLLKSQKRNLEFVTETLLHEREKESLRTELLSSELSFLRSQINPHLLFNSLNTIYNRVRKQDPANAKHVLALAELMHYSLGAKGPQDKVLVTSELEHIENYIDLQRMRFSTEIICNIKHDECELTIIPFLLITLIENIFQHGDLKAPQQPPSIELSTGHGTLVMLTCNQIRVDRIPGNGVGLYNTAKRLDLHYSDTHTFEYSSDQNIFKLKLTIKLK